MINRFLYTLYLTSRKRKLSTHYVNAGGAASFMLFLNVLTVWMAVSTICGDDFFNQFINNEWTILTITLLVFFGMQLYTYVLVRRYKTTVFRLQRLNPGLVLLYLLCTVFLFFSTFIIVAVMH